MSDSWQPPWTVVRQALLSFNTSWSLLKVMSIESVIPSSHLVFCCLLYSCIICVCVLGCNLLGSSRRARIFPGKHIGVGYHFLLQGIFPTQVCVSHTAGRFFTTELPILKKRNPERWVKWQLEEKVGVWAVKCHLTSLPVQFSMHFNFLFSYRVYIPLTPTKCCWFPPQ